MNCIYSALITSTGEKKTAYTGKTSTVTGNVNPLWNKEFKFHDITTELEEMLLEFIVWYRIEKSESEFRTAGIVRLASNSRETMSWIDCDVGEVRFYLYIIPFMHCYNFSILRQSLVSPYLRMESI